MNQSDHIKRISSTASFRLYLVGKNLGNSNWKVVSSNLIQGSIPTPNIGSINKKER